MLTFKLPSNEKVHNFLPLFFRFMHITYNNIKATIANTSAIYVVCVRNSCHKSYMHKSRKQVHKNIRKKTLNVPKHIPRFKYPKGCHTLA